MSASASAPIPGTLKPNIELIRFQNNIQELGFNSEQIDRITEILLNQLLPVLLANDSREWINRIQKGQINFEHHSSQRTFILANLPETANSNYVVDLIEEFSFDHLYLYLVPILGHKCGPILEQAKSILKMTQPHNIDAILLEIENRNYSPQQKADLKATLTPNLMSEVLDAMNVASSSLSLISQERTRSKPIETRLNQQLSDRLNAIFNRTAPSLIQRSPDRGAFVSKTILELVQSHRSKN